MLHTIINEGDIFYQPDEIKKFYKKVDNCVLEGVKYNQDVMLNRVISTNLKDYLNPHFRLGGSLPASRRKKAGR